MKRAVVCTFLLLCVAGLGHVTPAQTLCPPDCKTFDVPLTTHGEPRAQYLIPDQKLGFTVVTPSDPGVQLISTPGEFIGGGVFPGGGVPGTTAQGLSSSTPGSTVRALSCLDSVWDINFKISTAGATVGDKVTFFLQLDSGRQDLATFTVLSPTSVLADLSNGARLYKNNRTGPVLGTGKVGDLKTIYLKGSMTPLLTLLPPDRAIGCVRVGFEIMRAGGTGTTSVLISDIVVKRMGEDIPGTSLNGLEGTFPTGATCTLSCPTCPPPPPSGCARTQGFYKNHPEITLNLAGTGINLGNKTYTGPELIQILKTPVKGNGLISLAHQLIAAKLNIAAGANATALGTAVSQADALIGDQVIGGGGFLDPSITSALTELLTSFNEGKLAGGPSHCDS